MKYILFAFLFGLPVEQALSDEHPLFSRRERLGFAQLGVNASQVVSDYKFMLTLANREITDLKINYYNSGKIKSAVFTHQGSKQLFCDEWKSVIIEVDGLYNKFFGNLPKRFRSVLETFRYSKRVPIDLRMDSFFNQGQMGGVEIFYCPQDSLSSW
ncbi:MAG: hypothetical protein OXB88_08485 [Bacteriovoracales bacterium]|nr:hypothetical protein [Bacteriovoracales bacterium]